MFAAISTAALKRLLKLAINRLASSYIKIELEQIAIEIDGRDGIVRMHDLKVDCVTLNDHFLIESSFFAVDCSIKELEIRLNFANLFTDGGLQCKLDGFKIYLQQKKTSSEPAIISSNQISKPCHNATDGHASRSSGQGEDFIAKWVDVLIANFSLSIHNLEVIFPQSNSVLSAEVTRLDVSNRLYRDARYDSPAARIASKIIDENVQIGDLDQTKVNTIYLPLSTID